MRTLMTPVLLLASFSLCYGQNSLEANSDPLTPSRHLSSSDGRFVVKMNSNETLALYGKGGKTCWTSTTARAAGSDLNTDPRLILTSDELAIWATDPRTQRFAKKGILAHRGSGPKFSRLVIQNDGNLVLFEASASSTNSTNSKSSQGTEGIHFSTGPATGRSCGYEQ